MSLDRRLPCLFRLVDDSLRPYTDLQGSELISMTRDREKDLLIALSKVLREIQAVKAELDCDSDKGEDWESDGYNTSSGKLELQHEDHNCSIKLLAVFAILLTVESQFVQHLVGNVLVVVSELIATSGNEVSSFFPSLFICLKLAIFNLLPHSSTTSTDGPLDQNCDSMLVHLKSILRNANWSTASTIIQVLRNTLKYLKEEDDELLLQTYMDGISCFVLDIPWDVMEKIGANGCDAEESYEHNHFVGTKFFFLCNFIQLLCSLVEQRCSLAKVGTKNKHHPFLCTIISFVSRLFKLCLGKHRNCLNLSISLYFKHKLLMLMMRLSYQTSLGCSTLTLWLQLLHDYYSEVLCRPIILLDSSQDRFLEGSPFLASLSGRGREFSSSHLQRWGILLFLRCCFSLINLAGDACEQCACAAPNSCSTFHSNPSNARKMGFLELCKWLEGHVPADLSVSSKLLSENCTGFASSFLQLYIQEDDVLFKVLLQLLSIYSSLKQQAGEIRKFEDVNKEAFFQLLSCFNPVHLFHLLLAQLHYDHRVILDYLISKDLGASCAEYLLRSLRMVCDSQNLFQTFFMNEKVQNPPSYKKRKLLFDGSNVQAEVSSVPLNNVAPSSILEKKNNDVDYSWKHNKPTRQMFMEAKNCLLSLKLSIEKLHQKNLFPYNPEVLLRRLNKLQELCSDVDSLGISLTEDPT